MSVLLDRKTGEVVVAFAGDGGGIAELTWGQREIWAAFELAGHSIGLGGSMAVPPETTVDDVVAVLRFSMSRHQALRTRFHLDDRGRPDQQVVAEAGEVTVDLFDVDGDDEPGEFAAALRWEYEDRDFDYAHEWPVRLGVVRRRGVVTHVVVMYCHLIIDGYGMDAMNRDLVHLDRATGQATGPVAGIQPLDQARAQASTAGERQSDAAMRYWEPLLRNVSARRFPFPGPSSPRTPRYWQVGLISSAMPLAITAIAGRTGVDQAQVLLAAHAVSLARVTGINPSLIRVVVSNRFRPGFAESVSVVNQTGLCVIDVADVSFDEAVRRAWRSFLGAGLHAYYDPRRLHRLVADLSRERGEDIDLACFLNDARRPHRREEPAPVLTEAALRAARAATQVRWVYRRDQPNERMFLHINDVPDRIDLVLCGDTWHISPADLEACALGLEDIVVRAAFDANAATGVRATAA